VPPLLRVRATADSSINCILAGMAGMRRPSFLILSALALGPLHGYAVIKEVERLSADSVHLAAGTLYAALDRLTDEGLIEVDHEETVDGRLRRYYRLTVTGTAALAAEAEQMRRDARMVAQRLRRAGPSGAPSPA
jgi:DNA-binding PadR family transcriptional regulator